MYGKAEKLKGVSPAATTCRAFSFDIIPSSQIDNLTIVKSPSAEYPADYSGGFIIVNTKEIPAENSFNIAVGGNWNTSSAFKDFSYSKGSGTDFLGFDSIGLGIQQRRLTESYPSIYRDGLTR